MKSRLLRKIRKDIIKHTICTYSKLCDGTTKYKYRKGRVEEYKYYAGRPNKYNALLFLHEMIRCLLRDNYSYIRHNRFNYKKLLYGKSK